MPFSLKWILAATVYVAIAAAALARGEWWYGDVLWALTFLAIVRAVVVAIFARGRRQIAAVSFTVASIGFVLCAAYSGSTPPTERLLAYSGIGLDAQPIIAARISAADDEVKALTALVESGRTTVDQLQEAKRRRLDLNLLAVSPNHLRAANAVATLAFGLTGSLAGLMAFRAAAVEGCSDRTQT